MSLRSFVSPAADERQPYNRQSHSSPRGSKSRRGIRPVLATSCFLLAGFASAVAITSLRAAAAAAPAPTAASAISPADIEFFETRIRPVLVERCYKCHSKEADKVRGGLLLDSREGLLHGGNGGAVIVPGKPDESVLIHAIRFDDLDLQMPEDGAQLTPQQIADFTEWVRRGAPDPRKPSNASYAGVGRAHWSFQPVKKPALPSVGNAAWVRSPVDRFILAKLEAAGLEPNAPADKRTLLRRVSYDLIGLPPTEAEMDAFLADTSADAFAKVVDRLLASPHYGERWARHWLDVARYSDTKGDPPRRDDPRYPHAWTYRDYVIEAFNTDKPYNQFILEQLAADRIIAPTASIDPAVGPQRGGRAGRAGQNPAGAARGPAARAGQNQSGAVRGALPAPAAPLNPNAARGGRGNANEPGPLVIPASADRAPLAALGFLTLGNQFDGAMNDIINDRIDVTTKAFLGLTVSCARCHDHKFDPIPTRDYYSLYNIFANSVVPSDVATWPTLVPEADTPARREYLDQLASLKQQAADIQLELQRLRPAAGRAGAAAAPAGNTVAQTRQELQRREGQVQTALGNLEATHAGALPRAPVIVDRPRLQDYPVLIRGEAQNRGEIVPRRFLEILSPSNRPVFRSSSGRLELAQAIASPANPLTARVLVNRLWQHHFGTGFVATPDDLGNMSAPPSHPELLDYLATRFVEQGWSIKKLHREILLSNTYQVSADNHPRGEEIDPDNKLHWRYNTRRLDFEAVHDSLLAIAGTLDPTVGGKSIPIGSVDFTTRRAVYTYVDRASPAEILTQFDFPSPNVVSGRRYETIVPQQSLFLMNSPLVIETARALTERPAFLGLRTDAERVRSLYLAIFQRPPTEQETALSIAYVLRNPGGASTAAPPPTQMSQQAARAAQQQARAAARVGQNPRGGRGFQVEPGAEAFPTRDPVNAWTKLAHALFQTNEAMFYR